MQIKYDRIRKIKKYKPTKDKWGYFGVISLFSFLGLNHCLPLFHMSEIFVSFNSTWKIIYQFAIGYMINRILNFNKVFREQVYKFSKQTFHSSTMTGIRNVMKK